ncbi:PAS domain S-box protein [Candidatus Dependentiae bacterium]|nr:PAS domain S-box protein [Candidatus Dependentiae bacterium]
MFIIYLILSVILNFINVPLLFGVDMLFGGIFVFYILQTYGLKKALIASFVSAAVTFYHWNHFYAIIIFFCETLFVGLLYQKTKNIVINNLFYWTFAGSPLVIIFYKFLLNHSWNSVTIIVLKQAINGIFNSLIAFLIYSLIMPLFSKNEKRLLKLQVILFNIMVLFILLPALLIIINSSENQFAQIEGEIKHDLELSIHNHSDYLNKWFDEKLFLLNQTALKYTSQQKNVSEMQKDLELLKSTNNDFHNMYIADSTAKTIAFFPIVNEKGQYNIGRNFSDRNYFKKLVETKSPVISEIFIGRGGVFKPIITISSPIIKNGDFYGYILAAVNIDEIRDTIKKFYQKFNIDMILIDDLKNIVFSTGDNYKQLEKFDDFDKYDKYYFNENLYKITPKFSINVSPVQRWAKTNYIYKTKLNNNWELYALLKSEPFQAQLFKYNTQKMIIVLLLIVFAIIIAHYTTKSLIFDIGQLNIITENIPDRLNTNQPINWVNSKFEEFNNLNSRFKNMAGKLKEYIFALKENQELLESRIAERTSELESAYKKLQIETYENKLLINKLKLRDRAIEASNDGIIITDALNDNAIIFVNKVFEKITGYASHEVLGKNPRFLQGKNTDSESLKIIRNAIKNNESITIELLNYKKDRSQYWNLLSIAPIKDENDITTNFVGTQSDISLLKENQLRINAILATATEAIITIYDNGTIELFNNAAEKIFGYKAEEVIGKSFKMLIPPEYADKHDNYIKNYDAVKKIIGTSKEVKALRKNGEIFYAELSISEINLNNKITYTGILRDISDRKQFEKKLKEAKLIAETANQAKSAFLASISHEIRTPMNAIVSMSHFLEKTGLSQEQHEFINVLKNSSENLLLIIEQILDISKLENIKIKLEPAPFEFREIIIKPVSILDVKFKEKKLKFEYDIDSNIPEILIGDLLRLKQILMNILSNAIKFTETGFVRLEVKMIEKNSEVCEVMFIVTDTGIGVPENMKTVIFDKFMQADISVSRKFGGTGLGLSITKELINMMSGNIWVEDNKPHGSIFKFNIKFQIPSHEEIKTVNENYNRKFENLITENNYKILIAEDDKTNQFILKNLLKNYKNINYILSENGLDAVEKFINDKFDLILMDVNMPVMDGLTAVRKIREHEEHQNITRPVSIILFTATTIEQFSDKIEVLNISDYILKPIIPDNFYKKIGEALKYSFSEKLPNKDSEGITKKIINELTDYGKGILDVEKALNNIDEEIELYLILINQYFDDYGSKLDEIKNVFQNKIYDKMIFISHKLVTASANIGAYKLSSFSKQIENMLNEEKELDNQLYVSFIDEYIKINKCISEIKKKYEL